ncbi:major capsid protein [Pseudarthrobacter sp. LT1]|uniref:major capsid protein n=1 Tax=Pseudarthrobacter sp. LT1 TaxID=3111450 RepID=UPI002D799444|nr:major capsid protein [Pseudarthrobacter sp. LT1]WRT14663.1 major capsid protein [Pseudarthrobacter sp. LT1]
MALWTDLITPAELTGYVRTALEDLEVNRTSLAPWLPNTFVNDITVRFVKGQAGLVAEASFRAFDAEPEIAGGVTGQRVTLEMLPLGQKRIISEYDQLRARNASDEVLRNSILKEAKNVAKAIADRIERLRGTVLETGKATVNQGNVFFDDDFGRTAGHTLTAAQLWSTSSVDRLTYLQTLVSTYKATNDEEDPGAIVMSKRVFTALAAGDQFKTTLVGGATRPAIEDEVRQYLVSAGLPPVTIYDRRTSGGRVLSDNKLLLLPAPVDPMAGESDLGGTFWGQTLTSQEADYQLADVEQPGVVVGAHKATSIPHIATVESDAIALPVLANANLSLVATVL